MIFLNHLLQAARKLKRRICQRIWGP